MSNEAAPTAPAAATPAPSAPVVAPKADDFQREDKEPAWLPERLARERTAGIKDALKTLGVEDIKDAKAALDAHKASEEAKKTETEKLRAERDALSPKAKRVTELEAIISERATLEVAALTDAQKAAVARIAGDDPGAQLRAIDALKPTWATTPVAPSAAPIPKPATTSPTAAAPAPTAAPTDNKLATWEAIKATNPMMAASFFLQHQTEILAAKKARSGA
jgi:hypothetical protein